MGYQRGGDDSFPAETGPRDAFIRRYGFFTQDYIAIRQRSSNGNLSLSTSKNVPDVLSTPMKTFVQGQN